MTCSRVGSLLIGIFEIIVYGLALVFSVFLWAAYEVKKDEFLEQLHQAFPDVDEKEFQWFRLIATIVTSIMAVQLISAICLVVGVKKSATCLLKFWMVVKFLVDLGYIALAVMYFLYSNKTDRTDNSDVAPKSLDNSPYVLAGAAIIIDVIFVIVVAAFHRHLKAVKLAEKLEQKGYEESA